jgi:MFS transporter, FSR family, fosmidomycin resistance protein
MLHGVFAPRARVTEAVGLPSLLGAVHFLVDASSNFVMARLLRECPAPELISLLVLYNLFAFALQPLVGLAADKLRATRGVMSIGLLFVAAAMVLGDDAGSWPIVTTGLGNAAFHVGAGIIASRATPGQAKGLGLFIGPGAVGVVVGAAAGRSYPAAF